MATLTLEQKKAEVIKESQLALEQRLKTLELEDKKDAETIKIKAKLESEKKTFDDDRAKQIKDFEELYNTVLFPAPKAKAKRKKSKKPTLDKDTKIQMAIKKGYKLNAEGTGLVNAKGVPMNSTITVPDDNKIKHTLSANVLLEHLAKR
ncbi:hypothetical protein [Flavobacterium granuli]|uniref:Uncharacterized protein n=1 Tax=Flavobacterium granuli TaxID=280093 RepID=A0ABU1S1C5_9FLAO|nr:hypothetical protein [Flavobacterium granuli]MDR6844814.1 hypothetical protein [Flavobacterium granuli]